MKNIDNSTIEQLENDYWSAIAFPTTYLIRTIYELRSKRIGSFEVEDLRIPDYNGLR